MVDDKTKTGPSKCDYIRHKLLCNLVLTTI